MSENEPSKKSHSKGDRGYLSKIFPLVIFTGLFFREDIDEKFFQSDAEKKKEIPYSQFIDFANEGKITKIFIDDSQAISQQFNDKNELENTYLTYLPKSYDANEIINNKEVEVSFDGSSSWLWTGISIAFLTFLGWDFFKETDLKRKLFREKIIKEEESNVKFDDVAGIDNIKSEVQEIVSFLKEDKKNEQLGARMPKGLLLAGGPGNGKTLLAKAIAGEAEIPFYSSSGTDFENMYYGGSAKQVRELFAKARGNAPCIIFIDEIDAVGRRRSERDANASDSIVVELLNQMDGFDPLENVLVIAATNKPEVLDPALLRPGRFDRQIVVPSPDVKARLAILKVHTQKRPISNDVSLEDISLRTFGFSGADIANLVNEAAIIAARRTDAKNISSDDFDQAIDRITMGLRRNLNLSEDQQKITAIHEAGHTILALEKEKDGATPLHKVTIVPHGEALGLTMMRSEEEKYGYKLKELKSQLVVLFGGRVAEEIILGSKDEVGTGASGDIQQATNIAWNMVTKFGFSELGPIRFGSGHEGYLGPSSDHNLDEHTSAKVYAEVKSIVEEAESEARNILTEKRAELENLAEALITKETMSAVEVKSLLGYPKPQVA